MVVDRGASRLPRAGALSAAATHLDSVPAAAVAVRVDPSVDVSAAPTLLRPCVAARLTWHPALTALAGPEHAPTSTTTWTLPKGGPALASLLAHTHPGVWVIGTEPASPADVAALAGVTCPPPVPAPAPPGPGRVHVSASGRRVTLHLACDPVTVPGAGAHLTTGRALLLTPSQVATAVSAARKAGLLVVDADRAGRLVDLAWLVDRRLVATPAPGAPGWARVDAGDLVTTSTPAVLPAQDAALAVNRVGGAVAGAVDPLVRAALGIARAGACTHAAPGVVLHSWQELFIGAYLSGGPGLVNALPPGLGKTACAAGAMAAVAAGAQQIRGPLGHRGVVVAPVSLVTQWVGELGTFHPDARVVAVTASTDLPAARDAWSTPGHLVVVVTPAVLGECVDELGDWVLDDLIVDEGTFLRGQSAAAAAAWRLRRTAERACVLAGTPSERGPGTVAALTDFALGRTLARLPADGHLTGLSEAERSGLFVFGPAGPSAALPGARQHAVTVAPDRVAQVVQEAAHRRVVELLAAATTMAARRRLAPRLAAELGRWRAGLACPAALLVGASALARDVEAALASEGLVTGPVAGADPVALVRAHPHLAGPKVTWVADWVRAGGGQALVFADTPGALDVLMDQLPGARHAVVSGRVRPSARARAVDAFGAGGLDVLGVCAAGQHGLNLQSAARLAHLDVPASGEVAAQRNARAVRLGSAHPSVEVAVPVLEGTGETVWWGHACGARSGVDVLTLAQELSCPR